MDAAYAILWALWATVAIVLVDYTSSTIVLTRMFPEGRKGWHLPQHMLSMAHFSVVILLNPWR